MGAGVSRRRQRRTRAIWLLLATATLPEDDAANDDDATATPPRRACIVSLNLAARERRNRTQKSEVKSREFLPVARASSKRQKTEFRKRRTETNKKPVFFFHRRLDEDRFCSPPPTLDRDGAPLSL